MKISGLDVEHGDHVELAHTLHCFSTINMAWIIMIFNGKVYYYVLLWMSSEFSFKTVKSWRFINFQSSVT